MTSVKVFTIVGARPQFVKAAAVSRAVAAHNAAGTARAIDERIIHTGQHYDPNMSQVFFDELQIPRPAVNLDVGSGPHGQQTARMLERLEELLTAQRPDWVLVYGDTNSTLAAALAASKLHVPIAHVEAGLRSFNRRMPEEINRIVTDVLSSMLLCPTDLAVRNLGNEGITANVHQVGDVMYDSVLHNTRLARSGSRILQALGLADKSFYLATIHRAENTDQPDRLAGILSALSQLKVPTILPLHPRTRKTLGTALGKLAGKVRVIDPVAYLDMLSLEASARLILTDSGGVQKEAYWFAAPCVTLRDQTEWMELVDSGCNRLAGADTKAILEAVGAFEALDCKLDHLAAGSLYGDGKSSERIVSLLAGSNK